MSLRSKMSSACHDQLIEVIEEMDLNVDSYVGASTVSKIIGSSFQASRKMMLSRGLSERIQISQLLEMYRGAEVRVHPKKNVHV